MKTFTANFSLCCNVLFSFLCVTLCLSSFSCCSSWCCCWWYYLHPLPCWSYLQCHCGYDQKHVDTWALFFEVHNLYMFRDTSCRHIHNVIGVGIRWPFSLPILQCECGILGSSHLYLSSKGWYSTYISPVYKWLSMSKLRFACFLPLFS